MTKSKKQTKEKTQNRVYYEERRKAGYIPISFWIEKEIIDLVDRLAESRDTTRTSQIKHMLKCGAPATKSQ